MYTQAILKSLHIIFVVAWFAGLFYLPRLFVYHSMANDRIGIDRFKVMERKLLFGITIPSGILTILFGVWLWLAYGFSGHWLTIKMGLVVLLVVYNLYCVKLYHDFKNDRNTHGHVFYRWFNEFPVLILFAVVFLVVMKPTVSS